MFGKLLRNKRIIDREIELYKQERYLIVNKEIENKRRDLLKEIEELAFACARDKGAYEHTFHSTMEGLKIELAKLEALKEVYANDVVVYKKWNDMKDAEIKRLTDIINKMVDNQPKTVIQQVK